VDLVSVLPLAFVMVAGPQIISAFFFATGEKWKAESAAYVAGGALSLTAMVTAGYLLANGLKSGSGPDRTIDWIIVALLAFAMLHTFLGRKHSAPPKWMGKLEHATPRFTLLLGLLLLGFFPSDIVTALSVGGHLGNHDDPWVQILPFVGLTLLLLAAPALCVLILGSRAQRTLPKIRDWMDRNSWIVSEIVLAFFIAIVLSD
jgi:Sap, sulfolipid-1-addressing protein